MSKSILILGGGFAGVQAALSLSRAKLPETTIRLIDPKTYFEYHAALYRFVTGKSPMETCIPYRDIFEGIDVDIVQDSAAKIDLAAKRVEGTSGSHYHYDTLLLALGSETTTFGIEGISKFSYGMKSANEAHRLKIHIEDAFTQATIETIGKREPLLRFVVVGGGASGVELTGELASYSRVLATQHGLDSSLVHIDLVEAMPRLLANLPESVSCTVQKRLETLGVKVRLGESLLKEDIEQIFLKDSQLQTKTVVWTAGVRANHLAELTQGFVVDRKGRIDVDDSLRAKGRCDVFVLGDLAATQFSGMAQTALYDGNFVARIIAAESFKTTLPAYHPNPPFYAVPVGPKWAIVVKGTRVYSGYVGWMFRRYADFRVFLTLLPLRKAIRALRCIG